MPLPKPKKGEKEQDFINRCVGDSIMKKEFPDREQRIGVCYSQWRNHKQEVDNMSEEKRDEKGRIIIAENVPIIIKSSIEENEDKEEI